MRSPGFTIVLNIAFWMLVIAGFAASVNGASRIAVLNPEPSPLSERLATAISPHLAGKLAVVDPDLAQAAYSSRAIAEPFNMSAAQARSAANVIGCDLLLEIKTATQRRNAAGRGDYFEAYAIYYLISGRSGRLIYWDLDKFEDKNASAAEDRLIGHTTSMAASLASAGTSVLAIELSEPSRLSMEEVPDDDGAVAKGFRAPVPFRRIKPEYTPQAAFYEVSATVEIEVDLDASGNIMRTEIVRWAGFGLDESVEKAVRQMNWRPAERGGRSIPMRFVLRYNFRKKEQQ